jgi:RNA polymerase sigma factor (sigma-70 family)
MLNQEEFIRIIRENEALIYKVSRVYANTKEDEQDLHQEIVYQLWKSFSSFRNESKLSTWMYRIALNTSIAHLNKEKRKGNYEPISEMMLNESDINNFLAEERVEILYAHIRQLSKIEKAIILLFLEGKTYDEIAEITGFTATNIGTRLGRIKQKLKSQIKK